MIKRLFLAAAMLGLSSTVFAQAAPKPMSRSDFVKQIDGHFATVDGNHDGSWSRAELATEQQRELQQAQANVNRQMQAKFKQLDTNKDGQVSLQEFMAAAPPLRAVETPDQLLQKLDTNHDGKVTAEEFRAPQVASFNRADTNHDGIVTPAEAQAAARRK